MSGLGEKSLTRDCCSLSVFSTSYFCRGGRAGEDHLLAHLGRWLGPFVENNSPQLDFGIAKIPVNRSEGSSAAGFDMEIIKTGDAAGARSPTCILKLPSNCLRTPGWH